MRGSGRWGVRVPVLPSVEVQQRVAAHTDAQRLDRDHFVRRDVAEVHVGAELLDEPGLLLLDRRLEEGGISPDAEDGFPVGGLKGTGEQVWHRLRSVDMNHLPAGFILDPPSTHSISSHEDSPGIPQVGQ